MQGFPLPAMHGIRQPLMTQSTLSPRQDAQCACTPLLRRHLSMQAGLLMMPRQRAPQLFSAPGFAEQPLVASSPPSVDCATAIPAMAASKPSASASSGNSPASASSRSSPRAASPKASASADSADVLAPGPSGSSCSALRRLVGLQLLQLAFTQARHGAPVAEATHAFMQFLMLQSAFWPRQEAQCACTPLPRRHLPMHGALTPEEKHFAPQVLKVLCSA
mmetsp:Transcript_36948/g.109725  ORF Transcript_36948/g.109725 Transcript_36948/m.109725 type:complete len:220 (-) Transcript_36948:759-1418(-)